MRNFVLCAALLAAPTANAQFGEFFHHCLPAVIHAAAIAKSHLVKAVRGHQRAKAGEDTPFVLRKNGQGFTKEPAIKPHEIPFAPKQLFDDIMKKVQARVDGNKTVKPKEPRDTMIYVEAKYDDRGKLGAIEFTVRESGEQENFSVVAGDQLHTVIAPALDMAQAKRKELESRVVGFEPGKPYQIFFFMNKKNSARTQVWHDHKGFQFTSNVQLSDQAYGTQYGDKEQGVIATIDPLQWTHFGARQSHRIPPEKDSDGDETDSEWRFTLGIQHN